MCDDAENGDGRQKGEKETKLGVSERGRKRVVRRDLKLEQE